jgi:hypothetical protein
MKLSQDEEDQLIERIRKNPELARCLLEMTDIVGKDLERIDLADDAEEIVVNNIRKTGKELLTTWAVNKAALVAERAKQELGTRLHEKKSSSGIRF